MMRKHFSFFIISLFLISCTTAPSPSKVAPSPTPTSVLALLGTPVPQAATTAAAPVGEQTLNLWLPPQFAASPETPQGKILIAQLAEFQATQKWKVDARVKKVSGQGGLVNTLQTSLQVAPSAAPDVIALDNAMLTSVSSLLQPLSLTDAADYYAFTLAPVRTGTQVVAIPFATDTVGLAYTSGINIKAPIMWNELKRENGLLWLPLGEPSALLTLQQYAALEGPLNDVNGKPFLDAAILANVLSTYQGLQTNGILTNGAHKILDTNETWSAYREGRGRFAAVTFSAYLTDRARVPNTAFTVMPTRNGNRLAFATQWSYAIATPDPARRTAALELIRFLTTSERLGIWTFNAGVLPPRKSVLTTWQESGAKNIAAETLATIVPLPATWSALSTPIASAVQNTLSGQALPEAAAALAAEAVNKK
jgi:ABC-type glycerol-3-phosphate transport system substrate-binding protein